MCLVVVFAVVGQSTRGSISMQAMQAAMWCTCYASAASLIISKEPLSNGYWRSVRIARRAHRQARSRHQGRHDDTNKRRSSSRSAPDTRKDSSHTLATQLVTLSHTVHAAITTAHTQACDGWGQHSAQPRRLQQEQPPPNAPSRPHGTCAAHATPARQMRHAGATRGAAAAPAAMHA